MRVYTGLYKSALWSTTSDSSHGGCFSYPFVSLRFFFFSLLITGFSDPEVRRRWQSSRSSEPMLRLAALRPGGDRTQVPGAVRDLVWSFVESGGAFDEDGLESLILQSHVAYGWCSARRVDCARDMLSALVAAAGMVPVAVPALTKACLRLAAAAATASASASPKVDLADLTDSSSGSAANSGLDSAGGAAPLEFVLKDCILKLILTIPALPQDVIVRALRSALADFSAVARSVRFAPAAASLTRLSLCIAESVPSLVTEVLQWLIQLEAVGHRPPSSTSSAGSTWHGAMSRMSSEVAWTLLDASLVQLHHWLGVAQLKHGQPFLRRVWDSIEACAALTIVTHLMQRKQQHQQLATQHNSTWLQGEPGRGHSIVLRAAHLHFSSMSLSPELPVTMLQRLVRLEVATHLQGAPPLSQLPESFLSDARYLIHLQALVGLGQPSVTPSTGSRSDGESSASSIIGCRGLNEPVGQRLLRRFHSVDWLAGFLGRARCARDWLAILSSLCWLLEEVGGLLDGNDDDKESSAARCRRRAVFLGLRGAATCLLYCEREVLAAHLPGPVCARCRAGGVTAVRNSGEEQDDEFVLGRRFRELICLVFGSEAPKYVCEKKKAMVKLDSRTKGDQEQEQGMDGGDTDEDPLHSLPLEVSLWLEKLLLESGIPMAVWHDSGASETVAQALKARKGRNVGKLGKVIGGRETPDKFSLCASPYLKRRRLAASALVMAPFVRGPSEILSSVASTGADRSGTNCHAGTGRSSITTRRAICPCGACGLCGSAATDSSRLPPDCCRLVVSHLTHKRLCRVACVARAWRDMVLDSDGVWRRLYMARFKHACIPNPSLPAFSRVPESPGSQAKAWRSLPSVALATMSGVDIEQHSGLHSDARAGAMPSTSPTIGPSTVHGDQMHASMWRGLFRDRYVRQRVVQGVKSSEGWAFCLCNVLGCVEILRSEKEAKRHELKHFATTTAGARRCKSAAKKMSMETHATGNGNGKTPLEIRPGIRPGHFQ